MLSIQLVVLVFSMYYHKCSPQLFVLTQILLNYLSMLCPLIPLYTEEAWHHTPSFLKKEDAVYKLGWFEPKKEWCRNDLAEEMKLLTPLKESVLKILEEARQNQYDRQNKISLTFRFLGNSLQADLFISVPESSKLQRLLRDYSNHLKLYEEINC